MASDFNSLGRMVLDAIQEGVVPGLVVAVGQGSRVLLARAFGNRQVEPAVAPATVETVYDLASLTKALVTSVLAMQGVEQAILDLDSSAGRYLPALHDRPEVTLRRLLAHASGFPAHRKLYERVLTQELGPASRAAVADLAAAESFVYTPGSKSVYSDLGFILLGRILELAMQGRLDVLAEKSIFRPLGLKAIAFVDRANRDAVLQSAFPGQNVAATERCPVRQRLVVGEVHDLNAYAMGGVAGHAGLFGSIGDIVQLTAALCAAYRGTDAAGGRALVDRDVIRLFWQPAGVPGSTWRLGWDGPSAEGSMAGSLLSRRSVGHLSFTGCSIWLDPEQETYVIVLCNRIHPTVRADARFRAFRLAL